MTCRYASIGGIAKLVKVEAMKSRSKSSDTDVDSGWSCYAGERFIGAIVGRGSYVSGAKYMCTGEVFDKMPVRNLHK